MVEEARYYCRVLDRWKRFTARHGKKGGNQRAELQDREAKVGWLRRFHALPTGGSHQSRPRNVRFEMISHNRRFK